ncbi:unnamed protein product, partial [marine sediment metagenome]
EAKVTDDTLLEPFVNRFVVMVESAQKIELGGGGRRKPPGGRDGHEREIPTGVAMPEIHEVYEPEWENRKPKFDKYSALQIVQEEAADPETPSNGNAAIYSFWVNMDNIYLKTEIKASKDAPEILKARFMYGLVLVGMALMQEDSKAEKVKTENESEDQTDNNVALTLEDQVSRTSAAIAPVLLPLIESLGALTEEQIAVGSQVGDDE